MIKYMLSGITALFLVACTQVNSNGEKTITQGGDTVGAVDISLSKMDMVEELSKIDDQESSKLLFKASGTEPGWFAEIYNNKLRLVVDYGKDSLIMNNEKFSGLDDSEGYIFDAQGDKNASKNVIINIINKPCIASGSGDKMDRTVVISYIGKKYTGCGSFIK